MMLLPGEGQLKEDQIAEGGGGTAIEDSKEETLIESGCMRVLYYVCMVTIGKTVIHSLLTHAT